MIARLTIGICVAVIALAVLLNFALAKAKAEKEKKSWVSTASMVLFFLAFTVVLRRNWGAVDLPVGLRPPFEAAGALLVVFGTLLNVLGRLSLKGNWGDQIRIYGDHNLVTTGFYRYVRHPLYSGLLFIGYGCAMVYVNWLGAVLISAVFLPMMVYRASLEEKLLAERFPKYRDYARKTGMFLPKFLMK